MSKSEIERFVGDVKKDTKLQQEAKGIGSSVDSMVAFANQHGYEFNAQEATGYAEQRTAGVLSEEQLSGVTGAARSRTWVWGTDDGLIWVISN